MIRKMNHVGIVVDDLDEEIRRYKRVYGLEPETVKDAMGGRLRVAFIPAGGSEIELLQPMDDSTLFGRFMRTNGGGVHHIAFETEDIDAEIRRMKEEGVVFDPESPWRGAHGLRIIFSRADTTGGLSVELLETEPEK